MNYPILYLVACFALTAAKPLAPEVYISYPASYSIPYFVQPAVSRDGSPRVPDAPAAFQFPAFQIPSVQSVQPIPVVKSTGSEVDTPVASSVADDRVVQVVTPVRLDTPVRIAGSPEAFAVKRFFGQGDDGSYTFGYNEGPSSRVETGDKFGNKVGGFNYIDSNGQIQSRVYTAGKNGVQISGTDIPREESRAPQAIDSDTRDGLEEEEEEEEEDDRVVVRGSSAIVRTKRDANPAFFTAIADRIGAANFQVPYPRVANPIVNPLVQSVEARPSPEAIRPVATSIVNPGIVPTTYYALQTVGDGYVSPQFGIAPVQPIVYSGVQGTSYRSGILTQIPHSDDTFSYRVDS